MDKRISNRIKKPLDDSEIRSHLEPVKIIKYSDLKNYNNIEELLPEDNTFIILLVESSFNNGHWIAVLRYNNKIEYFDSYGLKPSENLKWTKSVNKMLGQGKEYLNMLFDKTPLDVIYNPIEYQEDKENVNTCGRHCILRCIAMKGLNMSLEDYYKFMNDMKKKFKSNYDKVVSYVIENSA